MLTTEEGRKEYIQLRVDALAAALSKVSGVKMGVIITAIEENAKKLEAPKSISLASVEGVSTAHAAYCIGITACKVFNKPDELTHFITGLKALQIINEF